MTTVNLGPHFHAVIEAWIRLEAASRYEQGPTNLPKKGRPDQVTAWISVGRGRRGVERAKVLDCEEYARAWHMWWDFLQPEWTKRGADGKWSVVDGYAGDGREWGKLYQWGVNGALSLIAALYFWGCAAREDVELEAVWEEAVGDVSWMLEGMAVYYEKFNRKF
ncbi:hypothetical protein DFH07DRAFT_753953 [Mycena maculata]|uniref:Uncharacterized protein n=1 Tax=Mycena maculata TaxID=230809 RepID=A0AAD7I527_9AGAR|nr:hypothetical protein DFH07DRAFT_753953 [Mycena maculata]